MVVPKRKPKSKSKAKNSKLASKTVAELKIDAKKKSINLSGVTKKADIIKVLSSKSPPKIEKSKSSSSSLKRCPGGVCPRPISKKSSRMRSAKVPTTKLLISADGKPDYENLFFKLLEDLHSETENRFGIVIEKGTFEKICFEKDGVLRDWIGIDEQYRDKILASLAKEKDRYEFLERWRSDLTVGGLYVSSVCCRDDALILIPPKLNSAGFSKLGKFYKLLKSQKFLKSDRHKIEIGLLAKECSCT